MAQWSASVGAMVLVTAGASMAADLMEILPVTDTIVMLHYREGHIAYNGVRPDGTYAPQGENTLFHGLLDVKAATDPSQYRVISPDHGAYGQGAVPVRIGYKAKGTEFNAPYATPQFLREYWVYAELPEPMQSGRTYRFELNGIAENTDHFTLRFDEKQLRNPAIHVSHVGYKPQAPKIAYLSQWMGNFNSEAHAQGALDLSAWAGRKFHVLDLASGEVVKSYDGIKLQQPRTENDASNGNWTRADVYALDFSDVDRPGRYAIVGEGLGRSYPFEIGEHVYDDAFRASMRSVFLQRKGIFKDLYEYGREYPRSHHPDMNKFVYGAVTGEGAKIDNPKPVTGIWGWYGDAGDWDGYTSHYVVPYTLLLTYDIKPQNFRDGDIGNRWREKPEDAWVEEGGNGVPDILDEAKWLVEFYRRARHELMRQGLGTGGVPGYVGRDADAHFQPSWNDKRELYISTEQAPMAYALAGTASYLAHCLNKAQKLAGSDQPHPDSAAWLKEAIDAFEWAERSGDKSNGARRQRQIAGVALYLATGDARYQAIFREEWLADDSLNSGAWVSPIGNQVAGSIYLISCKEMKNLDRDLYEQVKKNIVGRADYGTRQRHEWGFQVGGVEPGQGQTMNLITVPHTMFQAVAYEITGEKKYLDAVYSALDFVLGGNQEGISRLTGVGHAREENAFVCDAWYLLDFKHKVYRNPIFPGYSAYGLYAGWDVGGPGSEKWALSSTLPAEGEWPLGEKRMRNRYSISGSEFTIHQNQPWYYFATGYVLDAQRKAPIARATRPTVALELSDSIALSKPVELRATASDDTERVAYYYEWHYIGESRAKAQGFTLTWEPQKSGLKAGEQVQITAVAYDTRGEMSVPTAKGERLVKVAP